MLKSYGILYLVTDYIDIKCSILTHLDKESSCLDSFPPGIIRHSVAQTEWEGFDAVSAFMIHKLIKRSKWSPFKTIRFITWVTKSLRFCLKQFKYNSDRRRSLFSYADKYTNMCIWKTSVMKEHFSHSDIYPIFPEDLSGRNSPRAHHALDLTLK